MLNIAHRGFSSEFPENTIEAFDEGIKAGADGFECDLRLSSDGVVVVFHDDDFERLCGTSGDIETSTWSNIKKLKVKNKNSIPTLEEVLQTFHTTRINLEIKPSSRSDVLVEQVLRVMTKCRPKGSILFTSFDPNVIEALVSMDPEKKLGRQGILVETKNLHRLPESLERWRPDTWNVPKQILNSPWKTRWKAVKIPKLWTWTLDEAHEWQQVLDSDLPFEAIITNKPQSLHKFLKSQKASSS